MDGTLACGEVIVPLGVKEILGGAFSGNFNIKTLHIPESVESIGIGAFKECINLERISLPKSVTYISNDAFSLVDIYSYAIKGHDKTIHKNLKTQVIVPQKSYASSYAKLNKLNYIEIGS